MAFAEVSGTLLFAAKPGLYLRNDGPVPQWTLAAHVPPPLMMLSGAHNSGLRGLTVVGNHLLGGLEGVAGPIVRFDPAAGFAQTVEARAGDVVFPLWGLGRKQHIISAYNDMPPVLDLATGTATNLIGLQAHNPSKATSGWYLARTATGHYSIHEVPALRPQSSEGLVAVRTIHVSPFPEDHGQVLYLGGFDANFRPSHNTAWLYRVGVRTALK